MTNLPTQPPAAHCLDWGSHIGDAGVAGVVWSEFIESIPFSSSGNCLHRNFFSLHQYFQHHPLIHYILMLQAALQVSYMILQRVSPVTHSIGNCLKRVIVIVASVIFFQNPMSQQNMIGAIPRNLSS